jgi:hypothetical protein
MGSKIILDKNIHCRKTSTIPLEASTLPRMAACFTAAMSAGGSETLHVFVTA